jgi:integrase
MRHRDGQLKWEAAYGKYLKYIEQRIADSQNSYKPMGQGSLETAKAAYNYTKAWDKLFLSQITTHHIDTMIRGSEFSGRGYGHKKHIMRHIRSAFKYILGPAASIYLNPAHGIYLPRDKNDEPYKVIWIRPEIMDKVIDLLHGPNMEPLTKLSAAIYIHYYTGLRSGEGYAMEWSNIHLDDPKNSYMVVKATFNWRTEKLTPTKTGQVRTVDVTAIRQYLIAHKLKKPRKKISFSP